MCHQTRGGIPISIHSLRVEGDKKEVVHVVHKHNFNPLPPCGGRQNKHFVRWRQIYFNPLPPCGGRPDKCDALEHFQDFNPLPPCGGRLVRFCPAFCIRSAFQSTPSVWRETNKEFTLDDFSHISIHSLRVEGDHDGLRRIAGNHRFQSTPSGWRETAVRKYPCTAFRISIHSLRVEGDGSPKTSRAPTTDFNPLPPCGGRPDVFFRLAAHQAFQSTPSVWRETKR